MFCPKCGTESSEDDRYCAQCGYNLKGESRIALKSVEVIPNYLVQAILVTIFCFPPLGIPAIIYAAQVNSKVIQGDIDGAFEFSRKAMMWCWISFGAFIVIGLIYLLAFVLPLITHFSTE